MNKSLMSKIIARLFLRSAEKLSIFLIMVESIPLLSDWIGFNKSFDNIKYLLINLFFSGIPLLIAIWIFQLFD